MCSGILTLCSKNYLQISAQTSKSVKDAGDMPRKGLNGDSEGHRSCTER